MSIGQKIQAYRKKRGLTISELSALCGVSAGSIGNYERGATVPKRRVLEKLAQALDVPMERLSGDPANVPAASPAGGSDALLYNGVLAVLKERYGAVEGRTVLGENGSSRRYYVIRHLPEDFVLYENDIAAIARSAKESISPLMAYLCEGRTA